MDEAAARSTRAPGVHAESWGWLAVRIAAALTVTGAGAILSGRVAAELVPSSDLAAFGAGVVAACLLGGVLLTMVIAPLARSRAELTVAYQAALADSLRDPLTGLGNHRAFQEELERQVEASQRYDVPLSLAIVDLDEFKQINDTDGHAAGDRTLAGFGQLLATSVRRSDRGFRVGGDEFAILLPHTDHEGARVVLRRLLATALAPPLRIEGLRAISFSAGISALPAPAATRAQLYSQADSALYAAKRAGRTDVEVFEPTDQPEAVAPEATQAVADVIARELLAPVYQPILSIPDGALLGYEGLIRPTPPAPFSNPLALFAAAEASGRVTALDLACVEVIVRGARAVPEGAFLSVNLSPRTVEAPEFSAASLLSILARHGFPAERLVVELTEQQPVEDIVQVRTKLEACRRAGVRLAADDLGAGNAGLRLLSELRFDVLKVDLSLIQRSAGGGPSSDVVETVVGLAVRTGALVVGEGIEEQEQVRQLAALGVGAGQGYHLGRPGPLPGTTAPRPIAATTRPTPIRAGGGEPLAVSPQMTSWRQSIGLPT
jgi:diguanylate cyclase (GGDEF)-like protein